MVKDYSKGKIYKIVSDSTDDIYIGSTIQTLSQRLTKHRADYKECKEGKAGHTRSFSLIERGDYHIILIEPFPCNNQEELTARERYFIDNNVCLNKNIPGRTRKEYYQDNKEKYKEYREVNKEKTKEYNKEYYQANKEKIKEYDKEHYQANKEKIIERVKEHYQANKEKYKEHYQTNKGKIKEYKKEYYQANKEKIKEYDKERQKLTFQCLCDGEHHNLHNKARHFRSQYHITNLKAICDIHGVDPNDL